MKSVVDQLEVASDRVRVGAVTYSDGAYIQFQLNTYDRKDDVLQVNLTTVPGIDQLFSQIIRDKVYLLHVRATVSIGTWHRKLTS